MTLWQNQLLKIPIPDTHFKSGMWSKFETSISTFWGHHLPFTFVSHIFRRKHERKHQKVDIYDHVHFPLSILKATTFQRSMGITWVLGLSHTWPSPYKAFVPLATSSEYPPRCASARIPLSTLWHLWRWSSCDVGSLEKHPNVRDEGKVWWDDMPAAESVHTTLMTHIRSAWLKS